MSKNHTLLIFLLLGCTPIVAQPFAQGFKLGFCCIACPPSMAYFLTRKATKTKFKLSSLIRRRGRDQVKKEARQFSAGLCVGSTLALVCWIAAIKHRVCIADAWLGIKGGCIDACKVLTTKK